MYMIDSIIVSSPPKNKSFRRTWVW